MSGKREVLEALVWLSKWFGGMRGRLYARIREYEAKIVELLPSDTESMEEGMARVQFSGFTLIVEICDQGVSILSVEPPEFLDGDQLALFCEDEEVIA